MKHGQLLYVKPDDCTRRLFTIGVHAEGLAKPIERSMTTDELCTLICKVFQVHEVVLQVKKAPKLLRVVK